MVDERVGTGAPGWKRDPTGRFAGRYWDGDTWTDHVVSADKVRSVDPLSPAPPPQPSPPPATAAPRPPPQAIQSAIDEPSPRGRTWRSWHLALAALVGLIIGVAIGSAGKTSKDSTVGTSSATTAPVTQATAAATYKVGDTAKTGDFEVTVYGVKDPQPPPSQFDKPAAGSHYVSVDVQVANKGTKQQTFSSLGGFHLLDAANRQYDEELASLRPGPPEGQIPAGGAVRGFAMFEVPDGTTGLRLRVQGNLTASGAFFSLS